MNYVVAFDMWRTLYRVLRIVLDDCLPVVVQVLLSVWG